MKNDPRSPHNKDKKATIRSAALIALNILIPVLIGGYVLSHFIGVSAAKTTEYSSAIPTTKTPALQAAKNIDPSGRGGGDITIVGGSALLPETGPEGTLLEIEGRKPTSDQISIYVVRPGDTLSQIGEMFGVTANTVLWANDLKSSKDIHPGNTLVILPITGIQHTVTKGETLASIVKKYKGDMADVLAFNHLTSGAALAAGDVIMIPDGVETVVSTTQQGTSRVIKSAGGPAISGYFIRPIVGGIKTQGLHGYNGVDIAVPVGTNVVASADGTVMIARSTGWNSGYGTYVVIQHSNGTQTLYAHLSEIFVSNGMQVSQGQSIGLTGLTGRTTGPHIHFEVRGAANPF